MKNKAMENCVISFLQARHIFIRGIPILYVITNRAKMQDLYPKTPSNFFSF